LVSKRESRHNIGLKFFFLNKAGTKFIAVEDFTGEQKGDLAFKEKEILTLVKIRLVFYLYK
jgi:hypothetical protein